jgi:hypothetical protein
MIFSFPNPYSTYISLLASSNHINIIEIHNHIPHLHQSLSHTMYLTLPSSLSSINPTNVDTIRWAPDFTLGATNLVQVDYNRVCGREFDPRLGNQIAEVVSFCAFFGFTVSPAKTSEGVGIVRCRQHPHYLHTPSQIGITPTT